MILERPWGTEEIIAVSATYMGKILRRKAGTKGDLQSHLKHESHYLLKGQMRVRVGADGSWISVSPGQQWRVDAGIPHQEEAITECVEIEVSEPTLGDRLVIEASPDAGLPSTPVAEREVMRRSLALAYLKRASELLA